MERGFAGIRKKVTMSYFSVLSHCLFISVAGFNETEEYLTSDPSRLEVTDTGLKAQHCGHPDVEIPVIKCAL